MDSGSRIFVAGHRGLVGSAIVRALNSAGYRNLIVAGRDAVDLRNRAGVDAFFDAKPPEYIFLAAAKVGGILANHTAPADFLHENLMIQANVIDSAFRHGVTKLLFLGSSCIYPRLAPQPIREEYLLTGPLEPTNEWYAIAKITGIKMCQAYRKQYGFNAISLMPTNLYGPGDNFDLETSHVIPALIRKCAEAQQAGRSEIVLWGDGTPTREFLYVEDAAEGILQATEQYNDSFPLNLGTGEEVTIKNLALMIATELGYQGRIVWDTTKPNGQPRRCLDVSRIKQAIGFQAKHSLREGLQKTIRWFQANRASIREVHF